MLNVGDRMRCRRSFSASKDSSRGSGAAACTCAWSTCGGRPWKGLALGDFLSISDSVNDCASRCFCSFFLFLFAFRCVLRCNRSSFQIMCSSGWIMHVVVRCSVKDKSCFVSFALSLGVCPGRSSRWRVCTSCPCTCTAGSARLIRSYMDNTRIYMTQIWMDLIQFFISLGEFVLRIQKLRAQI